MCVLVLHRYVVHRAQICSIFIHLLHKIKKTDSQVSEMRDFVRCSFVLLHLPAAVCLSISCDERRKYWCLCFRAEVSLMLFASGIAWEASHLVLVFIIIYLKFNFIVSISNAFNVTEPLLLNRKFSCSHRDSKLWKRLWKAANYLNNLRIIFLNFS